MMPRFLGLVVLVLALPAIANGQFATPATQFLQIGLAAGPGAGVQAGIALPAVTVLTQEGVLYVDYRLGAREEQRLLVGLGVGGSVRVLRILYIIFDYAPGPFELDAGLRFGPSFAFSFIEETAATKARQFRLFADPFVRATAELQTGRLLFAELGVQPGSLRAGLVIAL
jgi:hypothetical protein